MTFHIETSGVVAASSLDLRLHLRPFATSLPMAPPLLLLLRQVSTDSGVCFITLVGHVLVSCVLLVVDARSCGHALVRIGIGAMHLVVKAVRVMT